jgi:NSS family neurotransmitter:Na+ symporter
VLAASGSAVGLGNVWKFPYITGENGGGWFVLIYLICIALVGLPIVMAEIMIGRAAQKQPVAAFNELQGGRSAWSAVGWMGIIAGFIILSYYVVVAGWAVDYTLKSVVNFADPIHAEAADEAARYRASTPMEEMRLRLIDRRTGRDARDDLAAIRQQEPPSFWRDLDRYEQAVAAAGLVAEDGGGDAGAAVAEAERRLRMDPDTDAIVTAAEALVSEQAAAVAGHRGAATEHYASLSEAELLDEVEDVHRRGIIADKINGRFGALATDGWTSAFWAAVVMLVTILIVSGGVGAGIERTCSLLMPTLIGLMIIMVVYGIFQPGFGEAISFVFKPDASKLKASGMLEALGHAFFTLSLGMGAMITYGSYQRSKGQLAQQSALIAGLDTFIALLACMMIFPIIFSYDQEPTAGPGLVFVSMPLAFAEIGSGGMLLSILFFGLLVFAALTSAISLLEVVASYFMDVLGWSRPRAAWTLGAAIYALGLGTAFHADAGMLLSGWTTSFGTDFFTTLDYLTSNWMLPLGGLFIAIYAGWVMPRRLRDAEIEDLHPMLVKGWLILVRVVAPALVILVLLQKVGILDADEFFHG